MNNLAQAFARFFANAITQILLTAVALSVLVSDQIVITTKRDHATPPFAGKCTPTFYTTDDGTVATGPYGCTDFLLEMTAIADRLGQNPPVAPHISVHTLNQNILYALIALVIATTLPIFAAKSPKFSDLSIYIGTLAGILAIVALAHTEQIARKLSAYNQTAAVGDGIYVLVACSLVNLFVRADDTP